MRFLRKYFSGMLRDLFVKTGAFPFLVSVPRFKELSHLMEYDLAKTRYYPTKIGQVPYSLVQALGVARGVAVKIFKIEVLLDIVRF